MTNKYAAETFPKWECICHQVRVNARIGIQDKSTTGQLLPWWNGLTMVQKLSLHIYFSSLGFCSHCV